MGEQFSMAEIEIVDDLNITLEDAQNAAAYEDEDDDDSLCARCGETLTEEDTIFNGRMCSRCVNAMPVD